MQKSAPAWTLQGRRSSPLKEHVPGPGTYNPSSTHMESSPQCKIGKSLRVFRSQIDYPGPGSYSPKDFSKASPRAT